MNTKQVVYSYSSHRIHDQPWPRHGDHLTGQLLIDMVGMVKKEVIKRRIKRWYGEQGREMPRP